MHTLVIKCLQSSSAYDKESVCSYILSVKGERTSSAKGGEKNLKTKANLFMKIINKFMNPCKLPGRIKIELNVPR